MSEEAILATLKEMFMAFGGATVMVVALVSWLGAFWQKRILQKEQSAMMENLESYRHELGLAKSSYEHYLELMLDYYSTYYDHYRLCQRACSVDAHRQPDASISFTKDDFEAGLDQFLEKWKSQEGKIRILLPEEVLEIHERSIDAFNEVKRAVQGFKMDHVSRERKHESFDNLDKVKGELESALRSFLRTEELLK